MACDRLHASRIGDCELSRLPENLSCQVPVAIELTDSMQCRVGNRTSLQQGWVGVDGCDGAHALGHYGIADCVAGICSAQNVAENGVHVVTGSLVSRSQIGQNFEQLYLQHASIGY